MSSNWKSIGRNSGNMSHHRNVASNKLNYENGKWDSIYDVSGKDVKGYTFDICCQNIIYAGLQLTRGSVIPASITNALNLKK